MGRMGRQKTKSFWNGGLVGGFLFFASPSSPSSPLGVEMPHSTINPLSRGLKHKKTLSIQRIAVRVETGKTERRFPPNRNHKTNRDKMEALNEQMISLEKQMAELRAEKRKMELENIAKTKAEEEKRKMEKREAYKQTYKYHIQSEMNRLMIEAMDEFSGNTLEGSYAITIIRKPEWDAAEFDEFLNMVAKDHESRLENYDQGIFHFNIEVHQQYAHYDEEDRETTHWEVSVDWDSNIQNPFEENIVSERDLEEE